VQKKRRDIVEKAGELEEITDEKKEALRIESRREVGKARTLQELILVGKKRGYNPGWAYHVYNSRKRKSVCA
jgi:hypothetical protein